jgi:lipoprotein-releasing system permease protein
MYKLLLCWRYLRTRYIALASIISVTLGVMTMIVVNSVMSGFANEMQTRIHSILSDIVFESHGLEGFPDFEWHAARIRELAGDDIAGMSPTVHVPAMVNYQVGGRWVHRQVTVIGIDPETYFSVSDCREFLQHPLNRKQTDIFTLREGDYDKRDHIPGSKVVPRIGLENAGMERRRLMAQKQREIIETRKRTLPAPIQPSAPGDPFSGAPMPSEAASDDKGVVVKAEGPTEPSSEQFPGIVLGYALASFRGRDGSDYFLSVPGDDVKLTFPTAGTPPKVVSASFTVVDFYESKMSEYDSAFVFVPISTLQEMRGMIEPQTGAKCVTAIQIRLKPGANLDLVRDKLKAGFAAEMYSVSTWRDKQGPLLAAVDMETSILNILLFLIIAVAGFGILAIFFMIVVEKTRDIGVLKSLGASRSGIMSIFLAYGVSLGTVGCGAGLVLGLLFIRYIDQIRRGLERLTGHEVFDPTIYYFQEIPTIVNPWTISWIIGGALMIAVLASVLPALRAARLHPVEALRYE